MYYHLPFGTRKIGLALLGTSIGVAPILINIIPCLILAICTYSWMVYILAVQCDLTIVPESGSITVCSAAPMRAVAPGQVSTEKSVRSRTIDKDVCKYGLVMYVVPS